MCGGALCGYGLIPLTSIDMVTNIGIPMGQRIANRGSTHEDTTVDRPFALAKTEEAVMRIHRQDDKGLGYGLVPNEV